MRLEPFTTFFGWEFPECRLDELSSARIPWEEIFSICDTRRDIASSSSWYDHFLPRRGVLLEEMDMEIFFLSFRGRMCDRRKPYLRMRVPLSGTTHERGENLFIILQYRHGCHKSCCTSSDDSNSFHAVKYIERSLEYKKIFSIRFGRFSFFLSRYLRILVLYFGYPSWHLLTR